MPLFIIITTIVLIICSILYFPTIKVKNITISSYWPISLIGALLLLLTNSIPIDLIIDAFTANNSMNPIKILVLFISMTILSIFLDEVGFFRYVANKAIKVLNGSQTKLFIGLYILISFLTVFTSNDIIILTFTPFICYFAKNSKINPIPYLISEFVAANTWSMALIIGNPTNIYLSSAFNIDFIKYLQTMILPTLVASVVSFLILYLLFRKQLKTEINSSYNIEEVKIDKGLLIIGLFHLITTTVLIAIASYINIEMWLITLGFSLSLILTTSIYVTVKKLKFDIIFKTLKRAPYALIPFVLSMFVIVLTLTNEGITSSISNLLNKTNPVFSFGIGGALIANLINNIPMSVLFANMTFASSASIYASIIASNIAAYITPVGALAGIMWMSLLKTYEINFSFKKFSMYGLIIGIPTLLAALLTLFIII